MLTCCPFQQLALEVQRKSAGEMINGPVDAKIARLVIVAADDTTHDHFVSTIHRLKPMLSEVDPQMRVVVWTTVGASASTKKAYEMPSHVAVVWIVLSKDLNSILRLHPDITVPVCIVDEATKCPAREQTQSTKSTVLKTMYANATLEALESATKGHTSALKTLFGGPLLPPNRIPLFVQLRQFKEATSAVRQLCILNLATVTPFRALIQSDLAPMIPCGVLVHHVRSRRRTLSTALTGAGQEVVTVSLLNALLKYLHGFFLDSASREAMSQALGGNGADEGAILSPKDLVTLLNSLTTIAPERSRSELIFNLKTRLAEFTEECPICCNQECRGFKIMSCCGYCVCDECFTRGAWQRCAFCRAPVSTSFALNEVCPPSAPVANAFPILPPGSSLDVQVCSNKSQSENLSLVLQVLQRQGYKRTIVVVVRKFKRSNAFYKRSL